MRREAVVVEEFPDDTIEFERWRAMTPEQRKGLRMSTAAREKYYQRDYYLRKHEERAEKHKEKWDNDPDYRNREIKRAQDRRAIKRAETAPERFEKMLENVADDAGKPHRPPVPVKIGREEVLVYSTAHLAVECGRKISTVRTWIDENVLPGVSAVVGGRAKFTQPFMEAVREACKRILFLDGRGDHDQLRLLILEELELRGESYVPVRKVTLPEYERPLLEEKGERVWLARRRR